MNSLAEPIKSNENRNLMKTIIGSSKRFSASNILSNKNKNLQLIKNRNKKKIKNINSLVSKRSRTINSNSQSFRHSCSFNENNYLNNIKNNFKTGIGNELFTKSHMNIKMLNKYGNKKRSSRVLLYKNTNLTNISTIKNKSFNNPKELQKKIMRKRRNSLIISHFPKNKKNDILSQINFNIQKTNQNLNNPDEFYSSYFNFLIEGELEKNNLKNNNSNNKGSMIDISRKKERINRNRSYISKK